MDKKSIVIPFDGFYESRAGSLIDSVIEQFIYYQNDKDYMRENGYTKEISYYDLEIDYKAIHLEFCKLYVSEFVEWLADEVEIKISLEFESLQSPRFYNFETDRIFCLISENDIAKLYNETNKLTLNAVVVDRHSSRSGFHSFYSNDLEEWKEIPVKEWDANMLETLLIAAILTVTNDSYQWPAVSTDTLLSRDRGFNERVSNMVDEHINIKGERK